MIRYFPEMLQGSDDWYASRCGLLTASEMKLIITAKTLKYSESEKEKSHVYELAAQRINQYVEPHYIGDDMLRGHEDEIYAHDEYDRHYDRVKKCGFVTNDEWGFTLGYSPDGLVGDEGQTESKSRRQKFQVQTIVEGVMPDDYAIQVQTGLLVTKRKWCDFISYCGGMHMATYRIYPDIKVQGAILDAATKFHERLNAVIAKYHENLAAPGGRFIPTIRRIMTDDVTIGEE